MTRSPARPLCATSHAVGDAELRRVAAGAKTAARPPRATPGGSARDPAAEWRYVAVGRYRQACNESVSQSTRWDVYGGD